MADSVTIASNALPLPLTKLISEQPLASKLPLTLSRKHSTLDIAITPTEPTVKRQINGAVLTLSENNLSVVNLSKGQISKNLSIAIAETAKAYRQMGVNIADDYWSRLQPFQPIANDISARYGSYVLIDNSFVSSWLNYRLLGNATQVNVSDTIGYAQVFINRNAKTALLDNSVYEPLQSAINLSNGIDNHQYGALIGNRYQSRTQKAVPVPCRYYPIPDTTPPPVVGACRIRPPSSQLPLTLTRKRNGLPSSALPLPLMCWHDQAPAFVPDLRSYIVLNTITATLGGIAIDPIDFNIKTDMQSYCWQGGIKISDSQYRKIKAKLDVARGNEPLVIVVVNGVSYSFIAEDISRNRVFGNYSYSISGRSSTARLGQDYAHSQSSNQGGTIEQDLYASQIINMQLADLPFSIDRFEVKDWLIPAGTFNVSNQTPISIIHQLAIACGGFVMTDKATDKISILPRWKKSAWELATATADYVIPMNVVRSINDQKRVNPRYNTVTLIGGTEASEIYRSQQGRDLIAPIDNSVLYTDRDCVVPKGQALLSDSGTHGIYSLKMRYADKYNIPLAELGQIWQINDPEGVWNGIITGVTLEVSRDNDAITVWQTVNIDRYLDV